MAKKTAKKPTPKKKLAPVPPNMAWISCYLTVKDAAASIAFYEKAFGFKKAFAMPGDDGKIVHAEMTYEDNMIMFGPAGPKSSKTPADLGGAPLAIYVYTRDVDALVERARKAGAIIDQEPKDQFYGDRNCSILDPDGWRWMFATRVHVFDPAKTPHP